MADSTPNSLEGVQVYDLHTGELGTIPHENLQAAIASGDFALPDNAVVPVLNPDGEAGTIPAANARDAFNDGFKYITPGKQKDLDLQSKYGEGLGNELKAFGAGAARTATFGLSDQALVHSGLSTPEALRERAARNPISNVAGEAAGVIAPLLLAPEAEGLAAADALNPVSAVSKAGRAVTQGLSDITPEATTAAQQILKAAGTHAVGSALEGAAFGLGQSVSEQALGDPDLNAEKVAANVGYSSLLGGALGGILGAGAETGSILKSKFFTPKVKEAALKDTVAEGAARAAATPPPMEPVAMDTAPTSDATVSVPETPVEAPTSLEELRSRVQDANLSTTPQELPAKGELASAERIFSDSQYPAHAIQLQSLDSPRARDVYKTFLDTGSDEAKAMRDYEALQKREGVDKLRETIRNVAPGQTLTDDEVKAGENVIKSFTDQYQAEQKDLAPFFKRFDETAVNPIANPGELLDQLEEAIPGSANLLDFNGVDGAVSLKRYSPTMPISRETYGAVKDLVDAVNEKDLTLGGLRNVRENMRDRIDWLAQPKAAKEITSLRKSLMDYIEGQVGRVDPEMSVRDIFRRYAMNEERRAIIESVFGGSISDKATFAKTIKPEDVIHRLFGNTVAVDAAKQILHGDAYSKALGDYLSVQMAKVTDGAKNGFSSNNFARFLRTKTPELQTAFAENPEALARLRAINTKMRILPDSPPVNPSGTAKSNALLFERLLKPGTFVNPHGAVGDLVNQAAGNVLKKITGDAEAAREREVINQMLGGASSEEAEKRAEEKMVKYSLLRRVEDMAQKATRKITSGTKALFNFSDKAAPGGANILYRNSKQRKEDREARQESFEEKTNQVRMWAMNPESLLNSMSDSTAALYNAAPNITSGIHLGAVRAVNFLASKLPQAPPKQPLSADWVPSHSDITKFERYHEAVEDPTVVLRQMKEGRLSQEALETVRTVYPRLYGEMQSQILDRLSTQKERVPYRTRLMLTQFLGQPMDNSSTPQAILANQTSIASPSLKSDAPENIGKQKPTLSGMKNVSLASRSQTNFQSVSNRADS